MPVARRVGGDRRAWLLRGAAAACCWPLRSLAVRVNDVPLYATLCRPAAGRRGGEACTVPAGSTVELVSEVAGPGVPAAAQRQWFVRVLDGSCHGAELSVPQDALRDERDSPTPAGRPAPPTR